MFTCNGCQKIGEYVPAFVAVDDEETDQYTVIEAPQSKDHKCRVNGNEKDILKAKTEMCNCVLENPTRGLQEVYETVRRKHSEKMEETQRQIFLQDFPSFLNMKRVLSRKRREVIPADPKLVTDIDTGLPAFLLDGVECMVKGDQVFQYRPAT